MNIPKRKFLLAARALSVLVACFLALFALDIFGEGLGFWEVLAGLFMHLIPSFVLAIMAFFSWNNPKAGAFGYLAVGLIFTFYFTTYDSLSSFATVSLPIFLISALFFVAKE